MYQHEAQAHEQDFQPAHPMELAQASENHLCPETLHDK